MGLISGLLAMSAVQKIKRGCTERLSIAQITNLIINLPDARQNLSNEEFSEIYSLFCKMQKCNTKMPMDKDLYLSTAVKIIQEFDKIAPYEKYSGGNEIEFSFLMEEIRGPHYKKIRELRENIKGMERAMREKDAVDRENERILSNAWSDEQLEQFIKAGEISSEQVEEYKKAMENVELLVRTAPYVHDISAKAIAEMKQQLHDLEQQS